MNADQRRKKRVTFDEIADSLPNGFHDSEIRSISVDYLQRVTRIQWVIDLSSPDEPPKEPGSADVTVVLRGVKYFVVEAPQPNYPFEDFRPLDVADCFDSSGCNAAGRRLVDPELLAAPPHHKFANSFFVNDWNSVIHVAADEAELIWAREDAKTQ